MKARIRGAAVIVVGDGIVFASHRDDREPKRHLSFWSPPGGGVEKNESILEAAEREALEEVSLRVVAERPIYAQEFTSKTFGNRTLELFILCRLAEGESIDHLKADHEIDAAAILTRETAVGERILPEVFATQVWDDLEAGFPGFRYLGFNDIP
jgi:8-oxo-dGTP diphosphatase